MNAQELKIRKDRISVIARGRMVEVLDDVTAEVMASFEPRVDDTDEIAATRLIELVVGKLKEL